MALKAARMGATGRPLTVATSARLVSGTSGMGTDNAKTILLRAQYCPGGLRLGLTANKGLQLA